ncbi:MAG: hypothetical protein ABI629_26595 [bacterium]
MRVVRELRAVAAFVTLLAGCGGGGGGDEASGVGSVPTPRVALSDAEATEAATGAGLTLASMLRALATDPPGVASSADVARTAGAMATAAGQSAGCVNGGSLTAACRVDHGRSVLTATARECQLDGTVNGLQVTIAGGLRATINDADVCRSGVIPNAAVRTYRFTDFQGVTRNGVQIVEEFTTQDLTQVVQPLGVGCAGAQAEVTTRGRVRVRRSNGTDLLIDALPLTLTVLSDGTPCAQHISGSGRADVRDYASGHALRAALDGLSLVNRIGAPDVEFDGAVAVDCIGALEFATDEPLLLTTPCASAGALRIHLPSGAMARSRFDASGLALDANGDGIPERTVADCTAASTCR